MTTMNEMKRFNTPLDTIKDFVSISFSGGKSSAYMTKMVLDHFREHLPEKKVSVVFANTGQEHPETLEFIKRCDDEFGFGTVWIEGVTNPERGKGMGYKIVTFETAARNGEPFEAYIAKYGIPNQAYSQCTSRLKIEPMSALRRQIGMKPGSYSFAVGIRADEIHRLSGVAMNQGAIYPLADAGVTKEDVRQWWAQQKFNLNIPEHLGNCTWCWKKSNRKLLTIAKNYPEAFDFPNRMEEQYALAGGERRDGQERKARTFFRGNRCAKDFLRESQEPFEPFIDDKFIPYDEDMDEHGSCGDTCEVGADKNELLTEEQKEELAMKAKVEYRVELKQPKQKDDGNSSTTTIAKAYCGERCIGRFSGIHAQKQAEALIVMAQAGATEASLSLCAADIGRAALHELSVKHHPEFDEISSCI